MHADQNPFRTQQIHRLPFQFIEAGQTIEEWVAQLGLPGHRRGVQGAIVGDHGRGKSTMLKAIERVLQSRQIPTCFLSAAPGNRNRRQIPDQGQSHPAKPINHGSVLETVRTAISNHGPETVVLLDSGECLSWWQWWRLRQLTRQVSLITTLHREGRLPTLYRCRDSLSIFLEHCHRLLAESDAENSAITGSLDEDFLRRVYQQARGNSREAFFQLYSYCSQQTRELPDIRP